MSSADEFSSPCRRVFLQPRDRPPHQPRVDLVDVDRVADPAERRRGLLALAERFAPGHMENARRELEQDFEHTAVLRIDIHRLTGKARQQNA